MKRIALSIALVGAALTSVAPANGLDVLRFGGDPVRWDGRFDSQTIITPDSRLYCAAGMCDEQTLVVDVPEGVPGNVQVTIRWLPYDGETDLDLYVLSEGDEEIASSAGVDSNAESVLLPGNGTYTIRVSPANSQRESLPYEGLVMLNVPPSGDGAPLLPNLIAFTPHNFHVASAGGLLPQPENPFLSCYPEETVENPGHPTKCLRFNQVIGNAGAGPLELRFNVEGIADPDASSERRRLVQRIYNDDGTFTDRLADAYEFHAVHGHIHYKGFGQSFLYGYDWDDGERGAQVRAGRKVGFCVIDVFIIDEYFDEPLRHGARTRTFPTCDMPSDGPWMVQGVDIGWADVYGWNLPDQYIDITDVPDGIYDLEQVANPLGEDSVLESDYTDNRASQVICLKGDTVTPVSGDADAEACTAVPL